MQNEKASQRAESTHNLLRSISNIQALILTRTQTKINTKQKSTIPSSVSSSPSCHRSCLRLDNEETTQLHYSRLVQEASSLPMRKSLTRQERKQQERGGHNTHHLGKFLSLSYQITRTLSLPPTHACMRSAATICKFHSFGNTQTQGNKYEARKQPGKTRYDNHKVHHNGLLQNV